MDPAGGSGECLPDESKYYADAFATCETMQALDAADQAKKAAEYETKAAAAATMPTGWEEKVTPEGQSYFVDHMTKQTVWERPKRFRTRYERKVDNSGKPYFTDHVTKVTMWEPPKGKDVMQPELPVGVVSEWDKTSNAPAYFHYSSPNMKRGIPPGWTEEYDGRSNASYYVDHNTKTTHWDLP